jgi:hypothetical protein
MNTVKNLFFFKKIKKISIKLNILFIINDLIYTKKLF